MTFAVHVQGGMRLCGCGCGQVAPTATKTRGAVKKGTQHSFVHGHHTRAPGFFRDRPPHSAETRARIAATLRGRFAGELNPNWGGGRTSDGNGYVMVKRDGHPMANKRGYVIEHRLVMSERIGRPLCTEEEVHHVNGRKADNRIENLWLFPDDASHAHWHASNGRIALPMEAVAL